MSDDDAHISYISKSQTHGSVRQGIRQRVWHLAFVAALVVQPGKGTVHPKIKNTYFSLTICTIYQSG